MRTAGEYRAQALGILKGNWKMAVIYTLVVWLITYALMSVVKFTVKDDNVTVNFANLFMQFLTLPLGYALTRTFLGLGRGEEINIGTLLCGYNKQVWPTLILMYVYVILWMLLLIIPGFIKAYSYSMTPYILADDPEIKNNAAIEKSMAMMKGNKWRLFCLDLSFIGWILLGIITLGIGFLWVSPYMQQAHAAFYEDLKAKTAE